MTTSLFASLDTSKLVWDEMVTGFAYRDRVINSIFQPHIITHPHGNFILMDGNTPVHHSRVVRTVLEQAGIPRTEWPANFPDLNIIEHAWDTLGRALRNSDAPTTNHSAPL